MPKFLTKAEEAIYNQFEKIKPSLMPHFLTVLKENANSELYDLFKALETTLPDVSVNTIDSPPTIHTRIEGKVVSRAVLDSTEQLQPSKQNEVVEKVLSCFKKDLLLWNDELRRAHTVMLNTINCFKNYMGMTDQELRKLGAVKTAMTLKEPLKWELPVSKNHKLVIEYSFFVTLGAASKVITTGTIRYLDLVQDCSFAFLSLSKKDIAAIFENNCEVFTHHLKLTDRYLKP